MDTKFCVVLLLILATADSATFDLLRCLNENDWGFKPNYSEGCDAYLVCCNSVCVPGKCPEGLYFNEKNNKCDYPENVECGKDPATTPTSTTGKEPTTEETTTDLSESTTETAEPESTTGEIETTTSKPETPESTTEESVTTTVEPESTSDASETTIEPETTTDSTESTLETTTETTESESTTDETETSTNESETTTDSTESTSETTTETTESESTTDETETSTNEVESTTDITESTTDTSESTTDTTESESTTETTADTPETTTDITESTTDLSETTMDTTESEPTTEITETTTNTPETTTDVPEITTETTSNNPEQTESTTDESELTTEVPETPTSTEASSPTTSSTTMNPNEPGFLCPNSSVVSEYPDPLSCEKYIICIDNEPLYLDCPNDLHYNPDLKDCDNENAADCSVGICPEVVPGTVQYRSSKASCSKYFICTGTCSRAVKESCAPTLLWNSEINKCDLEDNVECDIEEIPNPPEPLDPPTEIVAECTAGVKYRKIPDVNDCRFYYKCVSGEVIPQACPTGLLFDMTTKECNLESVSVCAEPTTTTPEPHFDCPTPNGDFQSPSICSGYITCIDDEATRYRCADGLDWNVELEECDTFENADCSLEVCDPVWPGQVGYAPSQASCNKYFTCTETSVIKSRCAPGLHWHSMANWCDLPDNVGCDIIETPKPPQKIDPPQEVKDQCTMEIKYSKFPHPEFCQHYYTCTSGFVVPRVCPTGLVYDIKLEQCNIKENAESVVNCS